MMTMLRPFQYYSKTLRKKFNGALPFRLSSQNTPWITPHAGFLITKYSTLQNLFGMVTMRLQEAGIIKDKITGSYLYFWQPPEKPELPLAPIGLEHIASGAILYTVGLTLALVAFIGEFLYSREQAIRMQTFIRVQPTVVV